MRRRLERFLDSDAARMTISARRSPLTRQYVRISNPVTQGGRFDPDGAYVRRRVSEPADVPEAFIHTNRGTSRRRGGRVRRDGRRGLPRPILDHKEARQRALDWFGTHRTGS